MFGGKIQLLSGYCAEGFSFLLAIGWRPPSVSCYVGLCNMAICFIKTGKPATAKSLQSCPTLCNPIDGSHQAPPSLGFSSKNTGVGCHFLLQCMKVKSESEVTQLCLTLSDSMDCSLPGSSIHGIFQARVLEWGAIAFSNVCYRVTIINTFYNRYGDLGWS